MEDLIYYIIAAAVIFMGAYAAYDYKMNYLNNPFKK